MDPPRICFLDLSTMDAGDLDFSPLSPLGEFYSFATTAPDQIVQNLAGANIAITNKVVIGEAEMAACPDLQFIQVAATGYDNVDLAAARTRGITVCNVRGYSSDSVAQHTICLLLNLATSVHRSANEPARWCSSPIFTRLDYPVSELAGQTLGIVGSGCIGSKVADIASALGMHIQFLARDGSDRTGSADRPRVPADEFFSASDVVSLHCPLTTENRHMIDAATLARMKPEAILINTSRGALVDEAALAAALESESIAAAGLDVLAAEPPPVDHPLICLAERQPGRLIITPHRAWAALEARERLLQGMVVNIRSWLAGSPINQLGACRN